MGTMGDAPAATEPPPRLPAAEVDLVAWERYAEALRESGDPDTRRRGQLMDLDLALPPVVDREQLATFHRACHRICRVRPLTPATWSLAHARDLAIYPSSGYPWDVAGRSPEHGTFANAHDFLRSAPGSRVEQLTTPWPSTDDHRPWRRLMRALPATCTAIALVHHRHAVPIGELLASLPDTVTSARIHRGRDGSRAWLALVDDRFATVDVDTALANEDDLALLAEVHARTDRVRLRVTALVGPLRGCARVDVGASTDPVLERADGSAVLLAPWTLDELQRHYGHVPIRAQLACTLPERHGVGARDVTTFGPGSGASRLAREQRLSTSHHYADLVRRGTAWTLRGSRADDGLDRAVAADSAPHHETAHNGRVLGESEIVPIADGDQLRFDGVECTFVDRAARAARAPGAPT